MPPDWNLGLSRKDATSLEVDGVALIRFEVEVDPGTPDGREWLLNLLNSRDEKVCLFFISGLRAPDTASGKPWPLKVETPTLAGFFDPKWMLLEILAQPGLRTIRRKIAQAREAVALACRSAISRVLALELLQVLLKLVAVMATEALNLIRPEPPPRVLSAGGQTEFHVPLN